MFILGGVKVLCFDTLLQVLILKVDSGMAGALAQFPALSILLLAIFLGNVGGKGVRRLVEYFMGYYTIWLAPVKGIFVPFWELGKGMGRCIPGKGKGQRLRAFTRARGLCALALEGCESLFPLSVPQLAHRRGC